MELTQLTCCRCGACCRWPGYVRLSDGDVEAIAAFLGMSAAAFTERFTRLTADRHGLSLTEQPDQSCIFIDADNRCRVHAVKPAQCREFPASWSFPGVEAVCPACRGEAAAS